MLRPLAAMAAAAAATLTGIATMVAGWHRPNGSVAAAVVVVVAVVVALVEALWSRESQLRVPATRAFTTRRR